MTTKIQCGCKLYAPGRHKIASVRKKIKTINGNYYTQTNTLSPMDAI